ncbi:tRNA (adenosine(37)-N6)-threonylcarbamoyltransferase complex ATPase subunit type 1 TsaE, partial [Candidatus Parcubacteria bacterium]
MIYISKSLSETEEIAANFAKTLHGGEFIGLMGDLGAGKTAFVKGVAKQLGVKTKIKSPTFTIINEYPVDYKNIKKIVHADFYRLLNPEQIEALNFSDYQNDSTII